MNKLWLIALGGGVGSVLRYLLAGWSAKAWPEVALPVGTIAVNVTGCLLIGALGAFFAHADPVREEYRLALIVGVLGGFTTFSAFGLETFHLVNQGRLAHAGLNVLITNGVCLAAVWAGYRVVERLLGA